MGTRGFRVVRYRGRYYCYYNRWDSYPEGLGKVVRREIPTEREEYAKWLAGQRQHYEALHIKYEDYLSVRKYDAEEAAQENGRSTICPFVRSTDDQNLPSYMPEDLRDRDAQWEYIVDLDREVFTVNNSAHMKLYRIPKHGWNQTMVETAFGDQVFLRGLLPIGCVTDLVLHVAPTSAETFDFYNGLAVDIIIPEKINHIASYQRHGPLLSAYIFGEFQFSQKDVLRDLLLGWSTEDLCFREIVHAILCIASPGRNISLVRSSRVLDSPEAGYSDVLSRDRPAEPFNVRHNSNIMGQSLVDGLDAEFVAHFGVGCHLQGNPPETSPKETIYWFEGVLVLLAVQLTRTGAVAQNVVRVFECHQQNRANTVLNAIIISIEHVILLTVSPRGNVQHTEPLPLFALGAHRSKDASARYPAAYLEALERSIRHERAKIAMMKRQATEMAEAIQRRTKKQRQAKAQLTSPEDSVDDLYMAERDIERIHAEERLEEMATNPGSIEDISFSFESEMKECFKSMPNKAATEKSFLSLVNFLESSARQNMLNTTQGRLPTEIYRMVIANLPDVETYRACMDVSTVFRDICHQDLWVMDNFVVRGMGALSENHSDDANEAQSGTNLFSTLHLPTGVIQPIWLCRFSRYTNEQREYPDREYFKVVIGSQRGRRSILRDTKVCLKPVNERKVDLPKHPFGSPVQSSDSD